MKINKLKKKMKLRKGDGGSNVALVALAIGVIIIIGMYVFTSVIGKKTNKAASGVNKSLDQISQTTTTFDIIGDTSKTSESKS